LKLVVIANLRTDNYRFQTEGSPPMLTVPL
jgi:hypothetical protein